MAKMTSIIRKQSVENVDCRLGIKHGPGIKCGQQTLYIKTALER